MGKQITVNCETKVQQYYIQKYNQVTSSSTKKLKKKNKQNINIFI